MLQKLEPRKMVINPKQSSSQKQVFARVPFFPLPTNISSDTMFTGTFHCYDGTHA